MTSAPATTSFTARMPPASVTGPVPRPLKSLICKVPSGVNRPLALVMLPAPMVVPPV